MTSIFEGQPQNKANIPIKNKGPHLGSRFFNRYDSLQPTFNLWFCNKAPGSNFHN